MQSSPEELWEKCLLFIKDNIPSDQYTTWILPIKPVSFMENKLVISVPSSFFYEYIEERLVDYIRKALIKVVGHNVRLTYRILSDSTNGTSSTLQPAEKPIIKQQPIKAGNTAPDVIDAVDPKDFNTHLNPSQTFDNFIEGISNKLCRAAGLSVAESLTNVMNPLFLYGGSGVGKTHLINAIGSRIKELFPDKRVLYISAHLFQVQFTDATRKNTVNDFINYYQTIDVLIIDDVQEFANWKGTQNTFFHIFNHLRQNGKQIIMTSDRCPSDLQGMEERLITRFKWGLTAEIERPNLELRRNILRSKIAADGLDFPEDVINYIAENVEDSVRELEGVVVSLMARSILLNKEIDVELASKVIKKGVRAEKKTLTIEAIVEAICKYFNLEKDQFYKKGRKREYVQARQMAMYFARKRTNLPLTKIGMQIAGKDYSTVIYSCNKVEDLLGVDKTFKNDFCNIEKELIAQ